MFVSSIEGPKEARMISMLQENKDLRPLCCGSSSSESQQQLHTQLSLLLAPILSYVPSHHLLMLRRL